MPDESTIPIPMTVVHDVRQALLLASAHFHTDRYCNPRPPSLPGGGVIFYLGTPKARWLEQVDVPLFVSRTAMPKKRFPRATTDWCLDSGGFTALNRDGHWAITPNQYACEVAMWSAEIGRLQWAAPMDWMCEPGVRVKTGLSTLEHQERTIATFQELRSLVGATIIPVLQGWTLTDYDACVCLYDDAGIDLRTEPVVGVGSICRRGADTAIGRVLRLIANHGIRMHAFGVRGTALARHAEILTSADSMAWSFTARAAMHPHKRRPNQLIQPTGRWCCEGGLSKGKCASCVHKAMEWRKRTLARVPVGQLRMEVGA